MQTSLDEISDISVSMFDIVFALSQLYVYMDVK